ncbi:NAD(P)/FAD-dependent oxidoreductase [Streptomyces sp. R11]|uniref:NAD(P)/FAD-dependent oxidoreductase n=1 Tax=Streptomyces sp. R11 TaxID=3238625 RepID=A0AB39NEU6_9ACTN
MTVDTRGATYGPEAVVIGGGLGGLLAAWVLAGYARSVTIVERDVYPSGALFRKGVPQGRHLHVLGTGGQEAMEQLLPGVTNDLIAAGALRLPFPQGVLVCGRNGWEQRLPDPRHSLLCCTRPLLDEVVRNRVLAEQQRTGRSRIQVLQGAEVIGLLGDPHLITGVRVRLRKGAEEVREISADFVVDASGRSSRAPRWLQALGCATPQEDEVDSRLAYASRLLRIKGADKVGINMQPRPHCPRGGTLVPVEGDRWLLTLYGFREHQPNTDQEEFLRFARTLPHSYIHDIVQDAEALSPVFGFRGMSNRRRHYDQLSGLPRRFLAVGDAVCTFNPVYGQGMSVAALGVLALSGVLEQHDLVPGITAQAQRAVAHAADGAWITATGADRPYTEAGTTRNGFGQRFQDWYVNRLACRSPIDRVVSKAFVDVALLTAPPARLFSPAVAWRTLLLPSRPGPADPPGSMDAV